MLEKTNVPEIQDAILILKELSGDEKTRYFALRREIALHDQMNAYAEYRKKGIEEGRKKGIEEGVMQSLKKMIESGIEEEKAKEILGL